LLFCQRLVAERNCLFLLSISKVHRCHSIEDLQRTPRPWVVLASQADLESGFSRELLAAWAGDANNSVVLVERGLPKSLAAALAAGERGPMVLRLAERKLLRGEELAEFSRNREIARLQELERQRNARSQQEQKEAMDDFDGREENLSAVTTLFVPDNPYFRDETQFDLVPSELGPGAPPPMFPFVRGASDASRQDNVGDWSP
jgi:Cft2 family RNA processing exonuclease